MISLFRNFAKSKWAVGLLVLVALGLLVTGGFQTDLLGSLQAPKVISAGDRDMSPLEFRTEMDRQRDQIQQQQGRPIGYEELLANANLGAILKERADQLGFLSWAWNAGVRPGDELVLRQIRGIPAFFDPVTNEFSEELYQSRLAEAKMTPAMLERDARDQYSRIHYGTALAAGVRLPRIYGAVVANQTQQTRNGRWFILTQAMAGTAPAPTDAQLTEFMNQNAARLRRPELRTGSLIVFSNPADRNIAIDEEKVQARFEFRKDALSIPERRSFVTLTAPTRAAADRIAAALRAGQDPTAVGQANDLQPAAYADTPRSAVGDPAVAGAVFGLGVNEVSAPVQARVGFVVARVSEVTPGRAVTLADVRDQIVEELRGQEMRAAIARRVEAYDAARNAGRSVEDAIRESGAQVVPIPAIDREGRNRDGQPVNVPANVREAMWKLGEGRAGEVTSAGEGQYFVVRVDDVAPAAMPALSEVREVVTRAWIARENNRLLTARAEALTARLRANEDIAAVAGSVGASVTTRAGVRQSQETVAELGQGVVMGLFNTPKGQAFSLPQSDDSMAIGRVDAITAPNPALAADEADQWRARLSGATGDPLFNAAVLAASQRIKASYNEELARQALGVAAAPAAPAQPAGR